MYSLNACFLIFLFSLYALFLNVVVFSSSIFDLFIFVPVCYWCFQNFLNILFGKQQQVHCCGWEIAGETGKSRQDCKQIMKASMAMAMTSLSPVPQKK